MACPIMCYFLQQIRQVLTKWLSSEKCKKVERYFPSQVLQDLQLWRNTVLPLIHSGMSLNLISYWQPSDLCWSDACPIGIGGFGHFGNAWRFQIPSSYRPYTESMNNCLEFVASIVTIWQGILSHHALSEDCILCLSDSSSAVGWLH